MFKHGLIRRGSALLSVVMMLGVFLGVVITAAPATANLSGSNFEAGDGNLVVNTTGDMDWNGFAPVTWSGTAPNRTATDTASGWTFTGLEDAVASTTDNGFAGGTKQDQNCPGVINTKSANKDDLARVYLATQMINGSVYLNLGWVRVAQNNTSSSADIGFEFNQGTAGTCTSAPNSLEKRVAGDMLILYDFQGGTPTVGLERWIASGTCGVSSDVAPCWGPESTLSATIAEAGVDSGVSPFPSSAIDCVAPPGGAPANCTTANGGVTLGQDQFGEAGINLTAAGVFPTGANAPCTGFGSAWAVSRSSASSATASMMDLVGPGTISVTNCVTKTFDVSMGTASPPISGTSMVAVYTTPDGVTHTLPLTLNGSSYTGSVNTIQPGSTLTNVKVELENSSGTVLWTSPVTASETITTNTTNSGTFNYALAMSPKSAQNAIDTSHTFTATVSDSGSFNNVTSSSAPLPGVPVDFDTFGGTPAGCGSLSTTSAVTNNSGQASTTISSTTACSTSIRAWINAVGGTSGFDTGEVNDTATKTFNAYALSVTPPTATNSVGTPHTFTLTLTDDTGSGPAAVSGQTVSFTLTPGSTSSTITAIDGTPTTGSPTSGTCTTDSGGQCTVTINGSSPGTATLNASYSTTLDSGPLTVTGSATKTYEQLTLAVTPATSTNDVGTNHTFTLTLENGTTGVSGQTVNFTLVPGTTNSTITAIDGTANTGSPTSGSCVTDANGACTVTINGTKPGTATLNASYTTTLTTGQVTITASATKTYEAFALTVTPGSATNDIGTDHTFTIQETGDTGAGATGIAGQTVNFTLTSGTTGAVITEVDGAANTGSSTSGSCTTDASGDCTVTIHGTMPGTATLNATATNTSPDSGAVSLSGSATKTYETFGLSVSPLTSTNDVGTNHTFTLTLTADSGSGPAALSGQPVSFTLTPGTTNSTITAIDGTATTGSPTSGTCTTDANGQCTVTINGTSPGTATLNATYRTTVGGASVTANGSGTKTYEAFALRVTPPSSTNDVNTDHVFTLTLTGDTGSGPSALSGQPVSFTLTPGTTNSTITAIDGTATTGSPTSGTCTTDANGQCTVTIHGTTPGTATLNASYTTTLDSGALTVTGSATKTYGAFALQVTPGSSTNNVGTNHVFTLTLTEDSGSGPTGLAGQTVTFTLTPGTTGSTITAINGTATTGSPTSGSCTTNSSGQCTVTINGTAAGTATLTASYSTTLDSGPVTVTQSATKTYEAFSLTMTPATSTNAVNTPHTFTITETGDTGSGPLGISGQTVNFTLAPGTTGSTITAIDGTATTGSPTSGSCITDAHGQCTVTIQGSKPGTATLSATTTNTSPDSGAVNLSASAMKTYEAFALDVTPGSAVNNLGVPHTFTITLTQDTGSGPTGLSGQTVSFTLAPGTTKSTITAVDGVATTGGPTSGTCTTNASGQCTVTIVGTAGGTATLTATFNTTLGSGPLTVTGMATKSYVSITVTKTSCAATAADDAELGFSIPYSTSGAALTNATITDNLPAQLLFVSASPAATSAPAVGKSGAVVWKLPTPLPNPSSGTVTVVATIAPGTPAGTVTNTGTFTADGGLSQPFSAAITVSNAGAAASGQAFGAEVNLLGSPAVGPLPVETNGATQLSLLSGTDLNVGLLQTSNIPTVTSNQAEDDATATIANVDVELLGLSVKATAVTARSDSIASGTTATSLTDGSEVLGLTINGKTIGDISSPRVIPVLNLLGIQIAEVDVLETTGASGAALGGAAGAQPQNGVFSSGLTVNGLDVKLIGSSPPVAQVIVAHAQSVASFPTLTPCAGTGPYVIGEASVAHETLTLLTPPPTSVLVGDVILPSTGGDVVATANGLGALGLAASGTATTETKGALSPLNANSTSSVQNLSLFGAGGINATAVSSSATAFPGASPPLTGTTTIAKLTIGTLNVCKALGLQPICTPAPNSVLIDLTRTLKIVLNEQIVGSNTKEITVNAIHIYVLGAGNPLGLPIGSDLTIGTSIAGTS